MAKPVFAIAFFLPKTLIQVRGEQKIKRDSASWIIDRDGLCNGKEERSTGVWRFGVINADLEALAGLR